MASELTYMKKITELGFSVVDLIRAARLLEQIVMQRNKAVLIKNEKMKM